MTGHHPAMHPYTEERTATTTYASNLEHRSNHRASLHPLSPDSILKGDWSVATGRPTSAASQSASLASTLCTEPTDAQPTYTAEITAEPGEIAAPGGIAADPTPPVVYLAAVSSTYCSGLRYERREMLDLNNMPNTLVDEIPPMNAIPSRDEVLGMGWTHYVHPEGNRYFRYQNFYTNTWLYNSADLSKIEQGVKVLKKELRRYSDISLADIEIGMEISVDADGSNLACYYIADMKKQDVYWIHPISAQFVADSDVVKILGKEHLGYMTAANYWISVESLTSYIRTHVYMFPDDRKLSVESVEGLRSDLNYHMLDKQTSHTSTAPYNLEDAHRIVQILKEITITPDRAARPQDVVIVGRVWTIINQERFIRYHGEQCAQLDSDKSIYMETHQDRDLWFKVISFIFFWTPQVYYDRLIKTWVDSKVNYDQWRSFISELQGDWAASITPSTVILSANVGFLAIQSVDDGGQMQPGRNLGQIVSYISTMLTIGHLVACTILARQHRETMHRQADAAALYLGARARSRKGVEVLATLFSIPTAFFAWGLLTFLIAIIWLCLCRTTVVTRVSVCVALGVLSLFIAWIIRNGDWQAQHQDVVTLSTRMKTMHKLVKKAPRMLRSISLRAATVLSFTGRTKSRVFTPDSLKVSGDLGVQHLPYGNDDAV